MHIWKIILLSTSSAIVLLILTKLMGNREMSQLSLFDYIIGITIGSIAVEMSTALESSFVEPLVAMIIYAIIAILFSVLANKSLIFRRLLYGNSLILFNNGELYKKNFKKRKMDINEFLSQCRANGYFNLNDLEIAILEENGKITFLPKAEKRPATPNDLNLTVEKERPLTNVILDGRVLEFNLKSLNLNSDWLQEQLLNKGYNNSSDIFLATIDDKLNLSIYSQNDLGNNNDQFI